jgi:hypothetical protein
LDGGNRESGRSSSIERLSAGYGETLGSLAVGGEDRSGETAGAHPARKTNESAAASVFIPSVYANYAEKQILIAMRFLFILQGIFSSLP